MSPQEWFWELEDKLEASESVAKGAGGFSQSEWAAARKAHKAKMGKT